MKTNLQQQDETRFVELVSELFQMDEAQALDFGIYRVIRRHNQEIRSFLGEIVTDKDAKSLQGGRLAELLDSAFESVGYEALADDEFRLKDLENQLGLKPGMTREQREVLLAQAEKIPAAKGLVTEYRSRTETIGNQQTAQQDRVEVLNRLYQFFSRHYQDGDFIVERRYGKAGARYVKSTGEDTEFHWATEDMYYIKSGDIFTDFPVQLASGQRVLFTVDPESLQATRTALKPNDKAHYALDAATKENDSVTVRLKYLKGSQTEKQKDDIVAAVQKAGSLSGASGADIRRWLGRFMARNQSDFFIHKRLKEALTEDLNIFIKTEVLDIDQLLAGATQATDLSKRVLKVARIVREVGGNIIAFLATLEDFQKSLWEKKKMVFETRYVITLDRLERFAPAWLAQNIAHIARQQAPEWRELGLGDYASAAQCVRKTDGDLATAATEQYLPLPVDTRHFDAAFKWSLLEAVTATTPLDDALDGVAIQSDNWQALNTLQEKYREQARCIYIDPPYNTDAGPINYKNGYRNASWMALMDDRLKLGRKLMQGDGVLCCTIDDYEQKPLGMLLERVFGENSIAGVVSIRINPSGRPKPSGFAVSHEYGFFVQNSPDSGLEKLDRTTAQMKRYKEVDEDGAFMWELFRKRGSGSEKKDRPTMYYPLYVTEKSIRVPKMEWVEATKEWTIQDQTTNEESCVYPIDEVGKYRRWRWKSTEVSKKPTTFKATKNGDGSWTIYYKYRPANAGVLPTTMWIDSKFSATEHGTGVLKKLFKQHDAFSYPKSVFAVEESLKVSGVAEDDALVIDFFAGSGTTAHAVLQMNATSDTNARFLVVEVNKYFESVTLPRIKKVAASLDWDGGAAQAVTGPGAFVRVQTLEQYDDTLESLDADINAGDTGDLLSDNPAFALRYRLDSCSRLLYMGCSRFSSPFGYQLKRAAGAAAAQPCEVDLIESLPYLLGLDVTRLYREAQGVVLLGRNRRSQSVAVLFRDCAAEGSADWVKEKMAQHPADRCYANDPAGLSFAGCDHLEAIESVFALQFGKQ